MKKIKKPFITALGLTLLLNVVLCFSLPEVFAQKLKVYHGNTDYTRSGLKYDSKRKTVFIVADNDGTEIFDLMAPFYLFNATEKANVIVVSENKAPILLFNSLFILPHYSFQEIDSLHIVPDVVVIPNMTIHLKTPPKAAIVNWIRRQYSDTTIILSICDGSATAAATGIYDGKLLTTHASDYRALQKRFPKAAWVRNVSVTESGNLYSTAGVSNAVEGSLVVIKRLFGTNTMLAVLKNVKYPHPEIKTDHKSDPVSTRSVIKIVSKVLFKKNHRIGVLLTDSINEFELASVLDTYVRSFPKSINSFSISGSCISSRYGLTLYPTGDLATARLGEFHVLNNYPSTISGPDFLADTELIKYNRNQGSYPIDVCLERISGLYGSRFKHCVKLMLDYN